MVSSYKDMKDGGIQGQADKILRIDPQLPYTRHSIVLTTPKSTQPILPTATEHASYLAQHCAPLESELLHQVTLFKSHLRSIQAGPEFWRVLAKGLTNLLGAQYCCISKRLDTTDSNTGMLSLDQEGSCILALAWYYNCGDSKVGLFEDVKYTGYRAPCGLMQHNTTALVPSGLAQTFPVNPNQESFVDPAEAYLSVPMFDKKCVNVGHVCLLWTQEGLDRCPYTWTTMEFVLHVFVEMAAQRFLEHIEGHAAFEQERAIAEAAVQQTESARLPSPSAENDSPNHATDEPLPVPPMFLPFPAAVAANISHEIRTPLQGIIGLLEILYAQLDAVQHQPDTSNPHKEKCALIGTFKTLVEGIQENSNRLMDFADKLGEYYSIAADHFPAALRGPSPTRKRRCQDETDEEVLWATGGAQRKFLKRRKLDAVSTTEVEDSSSTDQHSRIPNSHHRASNAVDPSKYEVSIRSTIRQIVKHVLTRHEVAAIWGGKKLGLMTLNPETRMRSILLGEGYDSLLLEWNVADDVPRWLYCGKAGLQKAITHLLVNAIKFTPVGRITLRVTRQFGAGKDMVLFSIQDTGIGVEEKFRHHLAQPFFQADGSKTRTREGSGLGLMLSQRWAEKMGGQLRLVKSSAIANDPERGSEFSLRLPIHKHIPTTHLDDDSEDEWTDAPRSVGSSSVSVQSSPTLGGRLAKDTIAPANTAYNSHLATIYPLKIMVVEDNEILRRVMSQLLDKLGYKSSQVVLCNNGQEAVDYFHNRAPSERDIDLILMDCWMPILDGLDATRQILDMFPANSKRYPGIKPDIVAITADNLPENLAKTEDSGMRGYMVKPIKLNDLQRVVEECAEGNWIMQKMVM